MSTLSPVVNHGTYTDTIRCKPVCFTVKLNQQQILSICVDSDYHAAKCYYIYNPLREENAMDGPHNFPELIPLRIYGTSDWYNRYPMAINHKERIIYMLKRDGDLSLFHIDTLKLESLPRSNLQILWESDSNGVHLPCNNTIAFVNETLYLLIEAERRDSNNMWKDKIAHLYRWDSIQNEYQLLSKSVDDLGFHFASKPNAKFTVPSQDLLISIRLRLAAYTEDNLPYFVFQRFHLENGRRDRLYLKFDSECLSGDILKTLRDFSIYDRLRTFVTADADSVLLAANWGYFEKFGFLIIDISDPNRYTVAFSRFDLKSLIRNDFGWNDKKIYRRFQLVGMTGFDGVLGAGMGRKSIGEPLPVVICDLIEMYSGGKRLHFITTEDSHKNRRRQYSSISVNHIMKDRIRIASQSEIIDIEHEIIDQENDENEIK